MFAGNYPCLRMVLLVITLAVVAGVNAQIPALDQEIVPDTGRKNHWHYVREGGSGAIYHRAVEGSSLPAAMISTTFAAPPSELHAIVTDYDHFAEFIPYVAESRIIKSLEGERWVYHRLQFPALVADRVYVIHSSDKASRPADNHFRIEWQLADRNFSDMKDVSGVTPQAFSGFWDLSPLEDGAATEARYAVHSDPGGWVPDWLVVKMTDRYLQQVVAAIHERIDKQ